MTISLQELRQTGTRFGLDDLGVVAAGPSRTYPIFRQWLDQGSAGSMTWLERHSLARRHPSSILPQVKTIIMVAVSEATLLRDSPPAEVHETSVGTSGFGEILGYGATRDYHTYLKERLICLARWLSNRVPELTYRAVADTAPLLEKEWAVRSGLGFVGKNSLLIHPQWGSRCFLGGLLLSAECELFSEVTGEEGQDRCGDCDRCVRHCPTGALRGNRTLDATKCLNYWTIEYRGDSLPPDIVSKLGNRLFGCDGCRLCCPLDSGVERIPIVRISRERMDAMTENEFDREFRGTPVARCGLNGLKRNNIAEVNR